jgi:hypothetical protein
MDRLDAVAGTAAVSVTKSACPKTLLAPAYRRGSERRVNGKRESSRRRERAAGEGREQGEISWLGGEHSIEPFYRRATMPINQEKVKRLPTRSRLR